MKVFFSNIDNVLKCFEKEMFLRLLIMSGKSSYILKD